MREEKREKRYLVVREEGDYVYWAKWNEHIGGFYFCKKSDREALEALEREKVGAITWENSTTREKRILGRLGYKLSKDFLESAPFETKAFYRKERRCQDHQREI